MLMSTMSRMVLFDRQLSGDIERGHQEREGIRRQTREKKNTIITNWSIFLMAINKVKNLKLSALDLREFLSAATTSYIE